MGCKLVEGRRGKGPWRGVCTPHRATVPRYLQRAGQLAGWRPREVNSQRCHQPLPLATNVPLLLMKSATSDVRASDPLAIRPFCFSGLGEFQIGADLLHLGGVALSAAPPPATPLHVAAQPRCLCCHALLVLLYPYRILCFPWLSHATPATRPSRPDLAPGHCVPCCLTTQHNTSSIDTLLLALWAA